MASSAARLRIGCVPEHFSSPLFVGFEAGLFKKHLVDVELRSCPGGTGEMVKLLEGGDIDVAVALTEGLVATIAKGNKALKIVGTYVDAPLCWAVSTAGPGQNRRYADLDTMLAAAASADAEKPIIGVSRMGSGSHIMAYVLAEQARKNNSVNPDSEAVKEPFNFEILSDFKGLRDGVNDGRADAFLWERFTTKPYHDCNEVSLVGTITPPWPAFLVAVRSEVLERDEEVIKRLLASISDSTALFMGPLLQSGDAVNYVATTQKQRIEDVHAWFKTVSYPRDASTVSQGVLDNCVSVLKEAGVLAPSVQVATGELCDLRVATMTA